MQSVFNSLLFSVLFVLSLQSASAQSAAFDTSVRYEKIATYTVDRLNAILTSEYAEFSSFEVTYPEAQTAVDLYRVSYPTVVPEQSNLPVRASGLIAIPQERAEAAPMLSYQHGTVFSKNEVPSRPEDSMETRMAIACFAAQGYVVIAADYIGKADSERPDSYMTKESTAQACLDMLFAARTVLAAENVRTGDLFLSGWSQGSFSTLVFLNRLETIGEPVKAAGLASCPSDLYVAVNRWIHVRSDLDVQWLQGAATLLIHSYENYYNLPGLSDIAFRPQYRQTARDLYENTITWSDAAEVFPETLDELLEPAFIQSGTIVASRFFRQLQLNRPYNWRFATPTRFYYGEADEVLSPYITTLPVGYQQAIGGASSTAVPAGAEANHRGTFAYGLKDQQTWFAQLLGTEIAE